MVEDETGMERAGAKLHEELAPEVLLVTCGADVSLASSKPERGRSTSPSPARTMIATSPAPVTPSSPPSSARASPKSRAA